MALRVIAKPESQLRGATVMIVVSGDVSIDLTGADCVLATENMYIAAASLGINPADRTRRQRTFSVTLK